MLMQVQRDYKLNNTLYISGTGGKDGSFVRDWMDNLGKLPFRNAHKTEKYKDVMKELKNSPDVTHKNTQNLKRKASLKHFIIYAELYILCIPIKTV